MKCHVTVVGWKQKIVVFFTEPANGDVSIDVSLLGVVLKCAAIHLKLLIAFGLTLMRKRAGAGCDIWRAYELET